MKKLLLSSLTAIAVLTLALGAAFGLGIIQLEGLRFFGPRQENVKREIFENSQSYVHGKISHISRLIQEFEDEDTSPAQRKTLLRMIELESTTIRQDQTPDSIRSFLRRN